MISSDVQYVTPDALGVLLISDAADSHRSRLDQMPDLSNPLAAFVLRLRWQVLKAKAASFLPAASAQVKSARRACPPHPSVAGIAKCDRFFATSTIAVPCSLQPEGIIMINKSAGPDSQDIGVDLVNYPSFEPFVEQWRAEPFDHVVLENFLTNETAEAVVREFPDFDSEDWRIYNNAIEVKKLLNHWDKFGPKTYRLFTYLNSPEFVKKLEVLVGCELFADFGLNGGGLHAHKRGGKLNTHLDYSIHPKLRLERRLNLLVYVTPGWQETWGGLLGLWRKHPDSDAPGELAKTITPTFNSAVIFDTTQDSWHGLPEPISCPEGVVRNSLAVYYLCHPRRGADERGKALFAPYKEQANDPQVLDLIKRRSNVNQSKNVYGDK